MEAADLITEFIALQRRACHAALTPDEEQRRLALREQLTLLLQQPTDESLDLSRAGGQGRSA